MQKQLTTQDSSLLFRAFTANGAFSITSGTAMLMFSSAIASFIGLQDTRWVVGLGAILVLFGSSLLAHAYRQRVKRAEAIAISAMDLGWVVASVILVVAKPEWFSGDGIVAILVVAAIVLIFFEMQAYALWKAGKSNG